MNYDQWVEKYKPCTNHFDSTGGIYYETFGKDAHFVLHEIDSSHVWTVIEGDTNVWIVSGIHYVNRLNFVVTDVSHDDEFIEVLDN